MESTEQIIKTFLETKGYLVLNNHKVKLDKNLILDLDIVAIREKGSEKDGLPNRIIGEVKSWALHPSHFEKFYKKKNLKFARTLFDRLKYINNEVYRKKVISYVNKRYGKNFKLAIFAQGITKKYESELLRFLKKEKIVFVPHKKIVEYLIKNTNESTYIDDPIIQFIRLMKKNKIN